MDDGDDDDVKAAAGNTSTLLLLQQQERERESAERESPVCQWITRRGLVFWPSPIRHLCRLFTASKTFDNIVFSPAAESY